MKVTTWRSSVTKHLVENFTSQREPVVIVYDLETTGLEAGTDKILSIAALKYVRHEDGTFEKIGELSSLVNPEMEISPEVSAINHITNDMVVNSPTYDEIFPRIYDFFKDVKFISGYNVSFDNGFLNAMYKHYSKGFVRGITILDVIEMARDLCLPLDIKHVVGDTMHPYKLCNVYEYCFGKAEDEADAKVFHDSREDTQATFELFERFIPMYQNFNVEDGADKVTPVIIKIADWFNPNRKSDRRIRIYTSHATFYFNKLTKRWGCCDDEEDLAWYDMEAIRSMVLRKAGVKNENELSRWRVKTA